MAKKATDTPTVGTTVAPEATAPEQVSLTIQDLTTAHQVINMVTARGAIKPEEMAVVGNLYNKLTAFLEASEVAKANAEQAQAAQAAVADASADTDDVEK